MSHMEFKVRAKTDLRDWEDIDVIAIESFPMQPLASVDSQADSQARWLLDLLSEAVEVRWNREGRGQGHYIR